MRGGSVFPLVLPQGIKTGGVNIVLRNLWVAPYPDETVVAATGGGVDEQSSGKNFSSNMSCSTTLISLSSKT